MLLNMKVWADSATPPEAVEIEPTRRPLLMMSLMLLKTVLPSVIARVPLLVALL
jgi:hypothetical protein